MVGCLMQDFFVAMKVSSVPRGSGCISKSGATIHRFAKDVHRELDLFNDIWRIFGGSISFVK